MSLSTDRDIGPGATGEQAGTDEPLAGAPVGRLRTWLAAVYGTLDPPDEHAFGIALDRTLGAMLPALGFVFGLAVVLFSAWDYWLAPQRAAISATVRLALVLLGAAGYFSWRGRLPVAWRYGLVYSTHTSAMILSAALLPNGLVLALPAITGVMFPLALLEPRLHRLFALTLFPSLLFLVVGAAVLPRQFLASCVLIYAVAAALVAVVAVVQGRLRRAAFVAERALAYSAHHDSLSGLLARGYLIELAAHDLARARRYGHPLTIGMLDIDHFKRVNDSFGHPAGDALIRAVSKVCSAELRASDYFGRIGGEEFVCVMPDTDQGEALACAERMRRAVAAIRLQTAAGEVRCTISIGIAALAPAHADFGALLAAADAALYQAKSGGRDRIEVAPPYPPG